jgi:hypothetical protein
MNAVKTQTGFRIVAIPAEISIMIKSHGKSGRKRPFRTANLPDFNIYPFKLSTSQVRKGCLRPLKLRAARLILQKNKLKFEL